MEKTFMIRRCYKGGLVRRGYKVSAASLSACGEGEVPVELSKVWSMEQYSSGCSLHRDCPFGHMCVTPEGVLLPPHSMSFRSGDIRTQYYTASMHAFDGRREQYIKALKVTNYGKEGNLRSIMSTPVSGSARLVCASHIGSDPCVVYISKNLADKILFCYVEQDEFGNNSSRYSERCLREGDYVMLERAPSLSKYNNQPFKVKFWANECLGIHPKVFSSFHGDYDGDEGHIYAICDPLSVEEASTWLPPLDPKLMSATDHMIDFGGKDYGCINRDSDMKFISYTTLGFKQIQDGTYDLPIGDMSRTKKEHLQMLKQRMDEKPGTSTFLRDSIKGVQDIMRQQMSQGSIGDMARVAKISAMCFTRNRDGGTYVTLRKSRRLLDPNTLACRGVPSVRCIMSLCQVSQQAALDAHRVGSAASTGLDMISDMLMGRSSNKKGGPCNTLYILQGPPIDVVRHNLKATFCCSVGDRIVAVARDDRESLELESSIVGAYSPVVLSRVSESKRRDACKLAICLVCNYYSVKLEGDDIEDLAIAMSYRVNMSELPITTRQGLLDRGLGWNETLMGTDYTKLPLLSGSKSQPWSPTSAAMYSSFDLL